MRAVALVLVLFAVVRLAFELPVVERLDMAASARHGPRLRGLTDYEHAEGLLFLGTSRLRSAVDRDVFERAFGLGQDAVRDLSGPALTPWDFLALLRHVDWPAHARPVVVVEVNPWTFSVNQREAAALEARRYPAEFPRWATWEERWRYPDALVRLRLVAAAVALPLQYRRSLRDWYRAADQLANDRPWRLPPPSYHRSPNAARALAEAEEFALPRVAEVQMSGYRFSPYWREMLEGVLPELELRGAVPVVVQLPLRAGYWEVVQREHATAFRGHRDYMARLASVRPVLAWETTDELALDDSVFLDYGHFSAEGSRRISETLAAALRGALAR